MVLKIKSYTGEIDERNKLEPMLVENPYVIEEGLRVITHQQQTDTGPLDILGVDIDGTLVVIELKNEAAEGHLDQGLRYYDWCRQNIAWISEAYKEHDIKNEVLPRLVLVAPSFTETVRRIAKYVAIGVELKLCEYHAVENEKGEMALICREVDFGEPAERPRIIPLGKKSDKILNPSVKRLWDRIIKELPKQGIEVASRSGYSVTLWYKGKRFAWMGPRRQWFSVNILSPAGGWGGLVNIRNRKEWDKLLNGRMKKYLTHIDATSKE